jgi:hypothetical protein
LLLVTCSGPLVRPNINQDSHKNGQKSGHLKKIPAQAARKLAQKKAVPIFSQEYPLYLGRKSKIRTKSEQFPQMSRIWDSAQEIGTTKGPELVTSNFYK